MRCFYTLFIMWGISILTFAQRNAQFDAYILQYKHLAIQQMILHRIPASITMAQGILESGAGTSTLAVATNNHFGIKKGANWNGPVYEHPDDSNHDLFRVYQDVAQSYEDHSAILLKPRYQRLFSLSIDDYKGWAKGLKECGYATNPAYAERLIGLIEKYELFELDKEALTLNNHNVSDLYSNAFNESLDNNSNSLIHQSGNWRNNASTRRRVFTLNNGIPCVLALDNDSWNLLANELGIKEKTLRKYNDAICEVPIEKGTFIYLKKKATRGPKSMKGRWHRVALGESMYYIAQLYGIRLKKLYKMNFKPTDYVPLVGDLLKIR